MFLRNSNFFLGDGPMSKCLPSCTRPEAVCSSHSCFCDGKGGPRSPSTKPGTDGTMQHAACNIALTPVLWNTVIFRGCIGIT